jgi:hypothetical protein
MFKKTLLAALLATSLPAFAGTYYVVVPVPGKSATAPVAEPIKVALSSYSLPGAVAGQPYAGFDFRSVLSVSGDSGFNPANVVWTVSEGALPQGLRLDAAGALTGTPTQAGTSSFQLTATYKGTSGLQVYSVDVDFTVALADATLPPGVAGTAYSGYNFNAGLTVSDAYAKNDITWSVAAGSVLPAGLTMDSTGALAGTPLRTGTYSFQVAATYKTKTAQGNYSVAVTANIQQQPSYRSWSDGTYASSCYAYRNPTGAYQYQGSTGDGVYRISTGGSTMDVYCDQSADGGGWTLVMRGYGGSFQTNASWNNAGALNANYASSANAPTSTTTFKLADATINAIRSAGAGIYRTRADGTYPQTRFWQSGTYGHTTVPPASPQETVSYATLSWTGAYAADPRWTSNSTGISSAVYGGGLSDEQGAPNYFGMHFGTNRGIDVGWIIGSGDASGPNYCAGSQANCNFTMWVR